MAGFIGENRLTELLTLIKNKFVTKDQVATASTAGIVKPDGTTITVDANGVISGNGGGASLPAGGTTGQALVKKTNADQDVEWADVEGTTYNAGDGILIDSSNDEISTDNMPAEDISEVISPLPTTMSRRLKYSTNEQIIGEWIDGEPIYQKVLTDLNLPLSWDGQYNTRTSSINIASLIPNINMIINSICIVGDRSYPVIIDGSTSASIKSFVGGTITALIIQYTKTID